MYNTPEVKPISVIAIIFPEKKQCDVQNRILSLN